MAGKRKKKASPDTRKFVQVHSNPSMGIETSTGQAWAGVDQQVGHGSADALFGLTTDQYVDFMTTGGYGSPYMGECWRGEHPDELLFHPAGGSWKPEQWVPHRTRMIEPPFPGELWWHVDALGEPLDSRKVAIARELAADTAVIAHDADGVANVVIPLTGEGAYPRPSALVVGLTAGSTREQVHGIIGNPTDADDEFRVEGSVVRCTFVDDGLTGITLERNGSLPLPRGEIQEFLTVLGEPEEGAAHQRVARLAGGTNRRWAAHSGAQRNQLVFEGGVEMQVAEDRVLGTRILLPAPATVSTYGHASDLLADLKLPAPRVEVRAVLGMPHVPSSRADLYQYGWRTLIVEYQTIGEHEVASTITTVLTGTTVSEKYYHWRSGDFTRFLAILGRKLDNPLVQYVRDLPGVRVGMQRGVVALVEIGTAGYQSERFATFIDGMPAQATRKELPFGAPTYIGDADAVWEFESGVIHVRGTDDSLVTRITVCTEIPRGLKVRPWLFMRDTWRTN